MVNPLTLEDILLDREVYEFLKKRYGDALPPPPKPISPPESVSGPCTTSSLSDVKPIACVSVSALCSSSRPPSAITLDESIVTAPSPTYSFPSLSDDESEEDEESVSPTTSENLKSDVTDLPKAAEDSKTNENSVLLPTIISSYQKDQTSAPPQPPTLYIRHRSKWTDIAVWCMEQKIKYTASNPSQKVIKMKALSFDDYEKLESLLIREEINFTYTPDKRRAYAMLWNIPVYISCEEIRDSLIYQDIPVIEVIPVKVCLCGSEETCTRAVVAVEATKAGKAIFDLKSICDLPDVTIQRNIREFQSLCQYCTLRKRSRVPMPLKCARCSGDHYAADCAKIRYALLPKCNKCRQVVHPRRPCPNILRRRKKKQEPYERNLRPLYAIDINYRPRVKTQQNNSTAEAPVATTLEAPVETIAEDLAKAPAEVSAMTFVESTTVIPPEDVVEAADENSAEALIDTPSIAGVNFTAESRSSSVASDIEVIEAPTSSQTPTHSVESDLHLVHRFFSEFNTLEVKEVIKLVKQHEGNTEELKNIEIKFAPVFEKLKAFRVNP